MKRNRLQILKSLQSDWFSPKYEGIAKAVQESTIKPDETTGKKEWYSDPFLLSNRITNLIDHSKLNQNNTAIAFDLIQRHPGAANSKVYGKMIASLAAQGLHSDVHKLYKLIERRNRVLSCRGYASLFSSIAERATAANSTFASDCMQFASSIWEKKASITPELSIETVNAFLKVCIVCWNVGGYNLAWEIFEKLGNIAGKSHLDSNSNLIAKCNADHITYSLMLNLCNVANTQGASDLGIKLWKDFVNHNKKLGNSLDLVDHELIRLAILLHSKVGRNAYVFSLIQAFFGLSRQNPSLKKVLYLADMITILQFCRNFALSRDPSETNLGLKWLEIVEEKQGRLFDKNSDFYRIYVQLSISDHQFEKAYSRLFKDKQCPLLYKLWICHGAIDSNSLTDDQMKKWWSRILEFQKYPELNTQFMHSFYFVKAGYKVGELEAIKSHLTTNEEFLKDYLIKKNRKYDCEVKEFRSLTSTLMQWKFPWSGNNKSVKIRNRRAPEIRRSD